MRKTDSDIRALRRLKRSELKVDKPLLWDVCDRHGHVLVYAGETLTSTHLTNLYTLAPEGVFAREDFTEAWDMTAEPRPVALEKARRLRRLEGDKRVRKQERYRWEVPITMELEESGEFGVRRRTIEAVTSNLSPNGFAFTYEQYIHRGTCVRVVFDGLSGKPTMLGVVRNCVLLKGTKHRVGVEFVRMVRKS